MGFFGTFVYSNGRWADQRTPDEHLGIEIHDSDIATIDYRPSGVSGGRYRLAVGCSKYTMLGAGQRAPSH